MVRIRVVSLSGAELFATATLRVAWDGAACSYEEFAGWYHNDSALVAAMWEQAPTES